MSDATETPIDRPIMLSDISALRQAIHGLQDQQLKIYQQIKHLDQRPTEIRVLAAVCVGAAMVCLGCALQVIP